MMMAAAPLGAIPARPEPQNQLGLGATWQDYQNASAGTNKKVWGGIAITIGGVAVAGAIVAIVLPFFVNGAPSVLNMGQQLGNAGGLGSSAMSFSATVGTIMVAGTITVGGVTVIMGAVLVHKGRKEAEEKEELKERFVNDGVVQFVANLTEQARKGAEDARAEGFQQGRAQGLRDAPAIALEEARAEAYARGQRDFRIAQVEHGVVYTENPRKPGTFFVDYSEVEPARVARVQVRRLHEENEARLQSIKAELARHGKRLDFDLITGDAVIQNIAPAAAAPDDGSDSDSSKSSKSRSSVSSKDSNP